MHEDIPSLPTILLRKHLSQLPEAARRHWTSCLSTLYAKSMVTQGYAAVIQDAVRLLRGEIESPLTRQEMMDDLQQIASLLLESSQELSHGLGQLESSF